MAGFTQFYGFSENPFATSPDPRFFFPAESHSEALSALLYGIRERKGFVLIQGEAGSGKTVLLRHLIGMLDAGVRTVFFPDSRIPFEQMLRAMLQRLEVSPIPANKGSMLHELYHGLIRCLERGENVVVIIDEAENIGLDLIEEVRLLANLETDRSKLIQIVLSGRPGLMEKLRSDVIRQIKQRIVVVSEIKPLSEGESLRYVEHRLAIVGGDPVDVFSGEALKRICRYAAGGPLALNILCSNALSLGARLGEQRVSAATVKRVRHEEALLSEERLQALLPKPAGGEHWPRRLFAAVLVTLIFCALLVLGWRYLHPLLQNETATVPMEQPSLPVSADSPPAGGQPQATPVTPAREPAADRKATPPPPETPPVAVAPSRAAEPPAPAIRERETIEVARGDTLYSLAYRYRREANETFIDHILKLNPEITDPNLIRIDQRIRIPEISEALLIIPSPPGGYSIHLKTFASLKAAEQYRSEVEPKGKTVAIVPWPPSPGQTWYRVMIGPFDDRAAAARAAREMNLF